MHDSVISEALKRLMAHGDAQQDSKLVRMASKKAGPQQAAAECPDCKVPLEDGKCPKCGYSADEEANEGDLAALLEQGAKTE